MTANASASSQADIRIDHVNTLDDTMKAFLATHLPIQATVSKDGLPDIGPKRSLRVYDDTTLIYNKNTGGHTRSRRLMLAQKFCGVKCE